MMTKDELLALSREEINSLSRYNYSTCSGCSGCSDCIGIAFGRSLRYVAFGVQLSPDEYRQLMKKLNP